MLPDDIKLIARSALKRNKIKLSALFVGSTFADATTKEIKKERERGRQRVHTAGEREMAEERGKESTLVDGERGKERSTERERAAIKAD